MFSLGPTSGVPSSMTPRDAESAWAFATESPVRSCSTASLTTPACCTSAPNPSARSFSARRASVLRATRQWATISLRWSGRSCPSWKSVSRSSRARLASSVTPSHSALRSTRRTASSTMPDIPLDSKSGSSEASIFSTASICSLMRALNVAASRAITWAELKCSEAEVLMPPRRRGDASGPGRGEAGARPRPSEAAGPWRSRRRPGTRRPRIWRPRWWRGSR